MHATTEPPDIVLFRPGALGDTLLTVDAILRLRRLFPGDRVELVGNRDGGRLLAHWGLVEQATPFDDLDVLGLFSSPPRLPDRWRRAHRAVFWLRQGGALGDAFAT